MCFDPRIYNAYKTTKKCIQFLNTIFYIKNSPRTRMFIDKSTIYFTNGNGKQFYWKTSCPGAWVRSKNIFHLNCWTTYPRSCTTFEFLVPIEQTRHIKQQIKRSNISFYTLVLYSSFQIYY